MGRFRTGRRRKSTHFDRKRAFFIGEDNVPERVTRDDWRSHARALGVPEKSLLTRLQELAAVLPELSRNSRASHAERCGDDQAFDRFEESILDRCGWVERSTFARG